MNHNINQLKIKKNQSRKKTKQVNCFFKKNFQQKQNENYKFQPKIKTNNETSIALSCKAHFIVGWSSSWTKIFTLSATLDIFLPLCVFSEIYWPAIAFNRSRNGNFEFNNLQNSLFFSWKKEEKINKQKCYSRDHNFCKSYSIEKKNNIEVKSASLCFVFLDWKR